VEIEIFGGGAPFWDSVDVSVRVNSFIDERDRKMYGRNGI
jgi:hypothetical protein